MFTLFAALGVDSAREGRLLASFRDLKTQFGLPEDGPVKYNWLNNKIQSWYRKRNLNEVAERFKTQIPQFRTRLYTLLSDTGCFAIAAGKKAHLGPDGKPASTTKTKAYAFCNLLQRLGMLVRYNLESSSSPRVEMVMDRPSDDFRSQPFEIYAEAWNRGHGGPGMGNKFLCGRLSSLC